MQFDIFYYIAPHDVSETLYIFNKQVLNDHNY